MGFTTLIAPWLATLLVGLIALNVSLFINWAIYRLAYHRRLIGPWYPSPIATRRRSWRDFIPIIGWFFMRSESQVHGTGFWVRPLLIEVSFTLGIAMLYSFEMQGGLLPEALRSDVPTPSFSMTVDHVRQPDLNPELGAPVAALHAQFLMHFLLISLMTIASFIDFDERLIPDWITVPGTLMAIILTGAIPYGQLLFEQLQWGSQFLERLHAASPNVWPDAWNGRSGLSWACIGFTGWCFALADRRVILRRGWRKAIRYFFAGLIRHSSWKVLAAIWVVGLAAIVLAHRLLPQENWRGVLSSILGMALGGAIVWSVRIVASLALRIEALGFGDVTLMAMIGAFLGWQPTWLAFFLAPMISIVVVFAIYLVTRDPATPYGPYLCVGTLVVIVGWDALFNRWAFGLFSLGSTLVVVLAAFLLLMGFVLWVWYWIKMKVILRS